MLDLLTAHDLFAMAQYNNLRDEAMELFDRCLTEGTPVFLEQFVQLQLVTSPPRLELLNMVAVDVHQRLIALRSSLLEMHVNFVSTLQAEYGVDLKEFIHHDLYDTLLLMTPDSLLAMIVRQNEQLMPDNMDVIHKQLTTSHLSATQVAGDIRMTQQILATIADWVDSISAFSLRYVWYNSWEQRAHPHTH